jgi:hypothetical protein
VYLVYLVGDQASDFVVRRSEFTYYPERAFEIWEEFVWGAMVRGSSFDGRIIQEDVLVFTIFDRGSPRLQQPEGLVLPFLLLGSCLKQTRLRREHDVCPFMDPGESLTSRSVFLLGNKKVAIQGDRFPENEFRRRRELASNGVENSSLGVDDAHNCADMHFPVKSLELFNDDVTEMPHDLLVCSLHLCVFLFRIRDRYSIGSTC